jgi:Tol biopolymer transport system component
MLGSLALVQPPDWDAMRPLTASRLLCLALGAALLGGLAAGCSSPSQAPAPASPDPAPETPAGPSLSLLYTTPGEALVLHDAASDSTRRLATSVRHDGPQAPSPSGRFLAFTYTTADSIRLALLDLTNRSLRTVDARPADATYSLAWHPSADRLAFAYYEPTPNGTRGPGDVFVAGTEEAPRDVGCSAAREVLDWLPDGALATRDDDRLYVVSPDDCATLASADARRARRAAYAPTGTQLAYIYRELTYDREARDYTPDSSLYLSDARKQAATELFGPERRVRHLRWAPDGSELAFDVAVEASGRRQVAAYNLQTERTVYVVPPAQVTADQRHPRWSPSASYVAFSAQTGRGSVAAVRVEGQTRRLGPVDRAVWGWLDDRTLVVPGPDSLRVQSLTGETRYARPAPATLIHAWRRDPA